MKNRVGEKVKLRVIVRAVDSSSVSVTYLACPFCETYHINNLRYECGLKIRLVNPPNIEPLVYQDVYIVEPCRQAKDPTRMDREELTDYVGRLLGRTHE